MPKTVNADRYQKAVSFRLDPKIKARLERLAAKHRSTMTVQLEMLIEQAPEN